MTISAGNFGCSRSSKHRLAPTPWLAAFRLASVLALLVPVAAAHAHENPIAYTSMPIDFSTPDSYWENASSLQRFTDVSFLKSGFGESDVVIRNPDGTDTIVYNCTASPANCAAQEAMPSPDGKRLAFSVTFGALVKSGVYVLAEPVTAKIFIYNTVTKIVTEIPNQSPTAVSRTPDWLDNQTIVMASDMANLYPVRDQWNCHEGVYPPGHALAGKKRGFSNGVCVSQTYGGKAMQIWRMKIDGTEKKNLTPQEANAMRPRVLHHPKNEGRIVYASWQNQEDRGFYQSSSGPGTVANHWWLMTMAPDGTSPAAFLGAHHSPVLTKPVQFANTQGVEHLMALRSVGEAPNGDLCVSNYYRGNHVGGMGSILCASLPDGDFHVEGCSTKACMAGEIIGRTPDRPGAAQYLPQNLRYLTTFGVGSDNQQNIDPAGRAMGVSGYPFALKNGHMMATWARGWCYNQRGNPTATFNGSTVSIGGEPLCDMNIAELLTPVVGDPHNTAQVRVLIGSATRHEFDAVELVPRPVTHLQPPLDAAAGCYLQVVDLTKSELSPVDPVFRWNKRAEHVGIQGNTVKPHDPGFHATNVKGLAIYGVQLHTTMYPADAFKYAVNYTGYQSVWHLGTQPMMADGSLKMRVPCEQTFYMAGVDAAGKWVTHDPWLFNLRKGETRTCHGCHDGHSVERNTALGAPPIARWGDSMAAATNPALLNARNGVFINTVGPIITKACAGCHAGFQGDTLLWSRVFADQQQLDFPWMKKMTDRNGSYALPRPYWSGLMGRYARQSLWVWVAEGKRLDGYRNEDYADDQDYPTGHPAVPVTPADIKKVVDYMQLGAPRGC